MIFKLTNNGSVYAVFTIFSTHNCFAKMILNRNKLIADCPSQSGLL